MVSFMSSFIVEEIIKHYVNRRIVCYWKKFKFSLNSVIVPMQIKLIVMCAWYEGNLFCNLPECEAVTYLNNM